MNRFVSMVVIGLALSASQVTAQEFTFYAPDHVETYSGTSHTFDVEFQVEQTGGALASTAGMSCAVATGSPDIEAISVEVAGIVETSSYCFFAGQPVPGGFTTGIIWDAGGHGCADELFFDQAYSVIRVTYEATNLSGNVVDVPLQFASNLGTPNVTNSIQLPTAVGIVPTLVDGSISLFSGGLPFNRGDCNADGSTNLSDVLSLLFFLFQGGSLGPCAAACDFNGDTGLGLPDVITLSQHLFLSGPPLPPPSGACGFDAMADCQSFPACI